tara:strand:+ start:45 stop:1109 length:1065 start_codon:yes stop_codon:yes gene_type:complete
MIEIIKKFVIIIITIFFTLLLLEIFSRNFIKKISTKIFHFDKNALIWNQEISSHAFKKPSKSIMTNGHFKEYIFIDKNGFRINSPEENIINPKIITIGDSQTFGHGISNADTWPSLLAKSTGLSVGNLGVWGYGMQNYDYLITNLVKNFKPKYLIYGMTDNDICSYETSSTTETKYKKFLDRQNESHFRAIINNPKIYFRSFTSLGELTSGAYYKIFYETSFGISLRPLLRPKTSRNLDEKCTMPAINWLKEKALFLKKHNIKTIVLQIPHPRRTINLSKGFSQKNYKRSVELIKEHQNKSFYFFIDPIIELSEHYKRNNYERASIILPVDTHNNRFSNNILANLVKEKINELE